MVITRVRPLSAAKVAAVLYVLIGLIAGAAFSLAALAGALASQNNGGAVAGALFGVGAIVLLPVIYGAMGFVFTLVAAALYNVIASTIGGVEVDVA